MACSEVFLVRIGLLNIRIACLDRVVNGRRSHSPHFPLHLKGLNEVAGIASESQAFQFFAPESCRWKTSLGKDRLFPALCLVGKDEVGRRTIFEEPLIFHVRWEGRSSSLFLLCNLFGFPPSLTVAGWRLGGKILWSRKGKKKGGG